MPLTASAVVGGLSAVGKIGVGIGQLLHSKDEPERPLFEIQDEYFTNRDIAARQAGRGLTDKSLDYYSDQAGRGLATTTNAILQAGGSANAAVGALDTYQQGIRSVMAEDSERQQQNIAAYIDRNDTVAKQKVQQWVINKYEPYKDKTKANAEERAAGVQNMFGGFSEATGTLASYSMAKNYEDLLADPNRNVTVEPPGTPNGSATTIYDQRKPSSEYSSFVDPYEVTPVETRKQQVKLELDRMEFDPTLFDPALVESYKRLYSNFN